MLPSMTKILAVAALLTHAASAHYANMAEDGVTCFIYNGIKGTEEGHMIVRNNDNTWFDHDDPANHGNITIIRNQKEYDHLQHKTKIGIVCAPDDVQTTDIGIPYVEREPSDEEFYGNKQTVYQEVRGLNKRFSFSCIIMFCRTQ